MGSLITLVLLWSSSSISLLGLVQGNHFSRTQASWTWQAKEDCKLSLHNKTLSSLTLHHSPLYMVELNTLKISLLLSTINNRLHHLQRTKQLSCTTSFTRQLTLSSKQLQLTETQATLSQCQTTSWCREVTLQAEWGCLLRMQCMAKLEVSWCPKTHRLTPKVTEAVCRPQ